jgi:hypothetical protein
MPKGTISFKRYAKGKYFAWVKGELDYHDAVQWALNRCVDLKVTFDEEAFQTELRQRGVPEEAIKEYLRSYTTSNDTYGGIS